MNDEAPQQAVATVIVAGPNAAYLFEKPQQRATQEGLRKRWGGNAAWVLAENPEALLSMLQQASLDGARCAVLLPIVPAGNDEMTMRREWREWRQAVARCAVLGRSTVAVYAAVYACLGPATGHPVRLSSAPSRGHNAISRVTLRHAVQSLRDAAVRRPPAPGMLRERLALSVLDWATEAALLAALEDVANTPPLFLAGVYLVEAGVTIPNMSAWLRWLTSRTGLNPALAPPQTGALPLPHLEFDTAGEGIMWRDLVAKPPRTPPWPWARIGVGAAVTALAVVLLLSIPFWRIFQDIHRYAEDLQAYESLPAERMFEKCAALLQLRSDHDELARSLGEGGLRSWALHQAGAEVTSRKLSEAIAAYRMPQTALRLDSMAAFESGSARLVRASALRLLEPAAQLLRANRDLHVRIVGHADATGSAEKNSELSMARAQAVRDELIAMSGARPDQFYVSGRGSSQPAEDNITAAGRAQNRRVEITLTPLPSDGFACSTLDEGIVPAD
ncbi:OmpA family protein [Achromobacter sp.]|uniref:OmpA family protein n=1 Tax=Achromobacter sp. TaxID=134375 RepID=UPI0028AB2506|nr:OmpA family protein [Achromobacter sp.]